jgi:hypothetical protein
MLGTSFHDTIDYQRSGDLVVVFVVVIHVVCLYHLLSMFLQLFAIRYYLGYTMHFVSSAVRLVF